MNIVVETMKCSMNLMMSARDAYGPISPLDKIIERTEEEKEICGKTLSESLDVPIC